MTLAICRQFKCLPSAALAEDGRVLRLLEVARLAGIPGFEEAEGGDDE